MKSYSTPPSVPYYTSTVPVSVYESTAAPGMPADMQPTYSSQFTYDYTSSVAPPPPPNFSEPPNASYVSYTMEPSKLAGHYDSSSPQNIDYPQLYQPAVYSTSSYGIESGRSNIPVACCFSFFIFVVALINKSPNFIKPSHFNGPHYNALKTRLTFQSSICLIFHETYFCHLND